MFNLPPLPGRNKWNAIDTYLDVPNNYYILDGKNSRLLDIVERREFERNTINGNEGFVLQIPFLECAFGTKYFVVDKENGSMMGIFDDKVEMIEAEAQMKPFNLAQLSHTVATLEQHRQGFNESSVAGSVAGNAEALHKDRLQYPSTPKEFQTFDTLKQLQYDGNMLTPEERSGLYWDCTKEDQVMCTKLGFPLIPVPSYFPYMHELEQSNIRRIEDTAFTETRQVESEMLVIMDELLENQEQDDVSNVSFHSSFSRICV